MSTLLFKYGDLYVNRIRLLNTRTPELPESVEERDLIDPDANTYDSNTLLRR